MADRDKSGRFIKGNRASVGAGRPRRATEERYLASLLKVVTPDEWKAVIEKLLDKAKKGDMAAIKMIMEYCVGRPTEYVKSDIDAVVAVGMDKDFKQALDRIYGP